MSCLSGSGAHFVKPSSKAKGRGKEELIFAHQRGVDGSGNGTGEVHSSSCPTSPSLSKKPDSCRKSIKRLKSLERILRESTSQLADYDEDPASAQLKLDYANCLCDLSRFREALQVFMDLMEAQERKQRLEIQLKTESFGNDPFKDLPSPRAEKGGRGRRSKFAPGVMTTTCSAPVFDTTNLDCCDENEFLTPNHFKPLLSNLSKRICALASQNSTLLGLLGGENKGRKRHASIDPNAPKQFEDYKVSPGQITPCPWSCPSCSGVLVDPISLPCGHTFCKKCLIRIAKAKVNMNRASCLKCGAIWFPATSGPSVQELGEEEAHNPNVPAPKTALEALEKMKVNILINRLCGKYWKPDLEAIGHRVKGNQFFSIGKYDQAEKEYATAVVLAPSDYYALGNLANVLTKLGRHENALEHAERAVKEKPDWAKGFFRKGRVLKDMGNHKEAFIAFFECLSLEVATNGDEKDALKEACAELFYILKKHVRATMNDTEIDNYAGKQSLSSSSSTISDLSNCSSNYPTDIKITAPQFIAELITYAQELHENQKNLQMVDLPQKKWFVRGVLSYRKPFREIDNDAVDSSDYECPLCLRLLWQPVTTSCGHTYCRMCLERALDHNPSCPLCKSHIAKRFFSEGRDVDSNEFIDCSLRRMLLKEYQDRKSLHESEMREIGAGSSNDTNVIPIFVCTISVPNIPCPLHIFEPRYRLMVRRAMESGAREFGMSCHVSDDAPFGDYGTMLEIRDVQYFPDGRSIIDTVGGRRFRVLERGTRDGYNTAKVEFIQDEPFDETELSALKKLHDDTFWQAGAWFSTIAPEMKAGILMHYGNLPEPESNYWTLPNGPTWIWWLLVILPLTPAIQLTILSTTSLKKRLDVVGHVLKVVKNGQRRLEARRHQ